MSKVRLSVLFEVAKEHGAKDQILERVPQKGSCRARVDRFKFKFVSYILRKQNEFSFGTEITKFGEFPLKKQPPK